MTDKASMGLATLRDENQLRHLPAEWRELEGVLRGVVARTTRRTDSTRLPVSIDFDTQLEEG
jgi:hypothetical protein